MSTLGIAMGDRLRYMRQAWKVRKPGRYGYITLELEGGSSSFVFYLLLEGIWKRLSFKRFEG
jgi:hypothetical protein